MKVLGKALGALLVLGVTALAALAVGTDARGQAPGPASTPSPAAPATVGQGMPGLLVNASTLVGSEVKDSTGQDVGEITELMVDTGTGQVAYAVLAAGGFLGMGKALFAVPFESLTVSQGRNAIVLNARGEVLPRAPSLSSEKRPDMGDPSFRGRVHAYWQDASITAAVKWKLATARLSSLRHVDVTTDQGAVTLRGSVENEETRQRAEAVAGRVAGVRRVDNDLEVHN
ncbi:MAG TPA: BON domain-containing protein [Methylomirabilota bacterium]